MSKSVSLIGAALLFVTATYAQDYQRYEAYLGYELVRFNPNTGYIPSINANGGGGQFVYNFNKSFGAVVDMGAVTKGVLGGYPVDTTVADLVAGPRFTWQHHESRLKPYVQALFGGAYATTSTQITVPPGVSQPIYPPGAIVSPNTPISARLVASNHDFAMLVGGGLDVKVSKHMYVRPFEADYYLTRLPSYVNGNHTNRDNFRYSAGVNFMFGKM
jgi:opacity protein-like surface antigen